MIAPRSSLGRGAQARAIVRAGVLAALTAALLPGTAGAKTFVASFDDRAGDGASGARDLVHARVAYNRRTGALSASLQLGSTIADDPDAMGSTVVELGLSSKVNGRCRTGLILVTGYVVESRKHGSWAWTPRRPARYYEGSASIEDDTLNIRVRAKGLSGRSPGCVGIVMRTNEEQYTVLDEMGAASFA